MQTGQEPRELSELREKKKGRKGRNEKVKGKEERRIEGG